jgi:hypothetical protein
MQGKGRWDGNHLERIGACVEHLPIIRETPHTTRVKPEVVTPLAKRFEVRIARTNKTERPAGFQAENGIVMRAREPAHADNAYCYWLHKPNPFLITTKLKKLTIVTLTA